MAVQWPTTGHTDRRVGERGPCPAGFRYRHTRLRLHVVSQLKLNEWARKPQPSSDRLVSVHALEYVTMDEEVFGAGITPPLHVSRPPCLREGDADVVGQFGKLGAGNPK